jgi:hypothetical protein
VRSLRVAWVGLNLLVALAMALGAAAGPPGSTRLAYVVLLFALCSSPLLQMRQLNDRFALLGVFLGIYFMFFGNIDLMAAIGLASGSQASRDLLSGAELLIVCGAVLFTASYQLAAAALRIRPGSAAQGPADWKNLHLFVFGAVLWLIGTAAVLTLNIVVVPEKTNDSVSQGLTQLGPWTTAMVILGNYLQPLGGVVIAYGYAKFRSKPWLLAALAVIVGQLVVGLICDIKGMALMGAVIVVLVLVLVHGRVPLAWVLGAALGAAMVFPVLQAYRGVIAGGGLSRADALQDFSGSLRAALQARKSVMRGAPDERAQTIFERSNLKPSVELAVSATGRGTPFQYGRTLEPLLSTFIPRLLWAKKPDIAVGQEFAQQFGLDVGENTYISPSHLGEFYWNFGWPGALGGMTLIGLLFGAVGARCDLSAGASVTRVLVLLSTSVLLGLGFESTVAAQYSVWARSMVVVWLLHLVLSRRTAARAPPTGPAPDTARDDRPRLDPATVPVARFAHRATGPA